MVTTARRQHTRSCRNRHWIQTDDPLDLHGIHDGGINLAIWRRPQDRALTQAATALAQKGDDWRCALAGVEAETLLDSAASLQDLLPRRLRVAHPAACRLLLTDVWRLVRLHHEVTKDPRLDLSLARLTVPQCPRFHTDHVGVRLIHTFCGAGTEWLRNEDVDRRALASQHRTDAPPVRNPRFRIQRVEAQSVALLRGSAAPGNSKNGIVHRSPDPMGQPRLMLVVDRAHEETSGHGACPTMR